MHLPGNSTQQSSSWEANSLRATQDIPRLSWNSMKKPLFPNLVHILPPHFLNPASIEFPIFAYAFQAFLSFRLSDKIS
jgi:hypothetical protein